MLETGSVDVLCIDPHDQEVPDRLKGADQRISTQTVPDAESAFDVMSDRGQDCVLLPGELPEEDVTGVLESFARRHSETPTVVRDCSAELAAEALEAGATEIFRQSQGQVGDGILVNRILNAVGQHATRRTANERNRRLHALLSGSSDRLSLIDGDGYYQFVSPASEPIIEYGPSDLLDTDTGRRERIFDRIHTEHESHVQDALDRVQNRAGESISVEYRLEDADGQWQWVESRFVNRLNYEGVEGIVVTTREITDRKVREQQLVEERAFNESIFTALPDVFYAFDEHGNFLKWNDRLSAVTGYDDGEIEKMHPVDFVASEDAPVIVDAISEVFENDGTVTVEGRFETKDGERIPYEFTGTKMTDDDGETLGLVGIGRDISDRREREHQLEAEKERFRTLFEELTQPTVEVSFEDVDPIVKQVNPAFEETFGYTAEEIVDEPLDEFVVADDQTAEAEGINQQVSEGDGIEAREVTRITEEEPRNFLLQSAVYDDGSEGFGVYTDITDRKKREQRLREERHRFQTLFERLPQPTVEFEFDRGEPVVKHVNPAFEETFGYTAEEIVDEPLDEYVVTHEQQEEAADLNQRVQQGERVFAEELTRHTVDGPREFLFQTAVYNEGSEGFAVYTDITEQKERERELSYKQSLLEAVSQADLEGRVVIDGDRNIVLYNDRFAEMWGIPEHLLEEGCDEEALEYVLDDLEHPEEFLEKIEYLYENPAEQSRDTVHLEDGRVFDRYSDSVTGEDGSYYGRVWSFHDISERKAYERELERQNGLFRQVQEIADIGAWECDLANEDTWVTEQVASILDESAGTVPTPEEWVSYLHPDDRSVFEEAWTEALEAGESFDLELRLDGQSHDSRWIRMQATPQEGDEGVVAVRGTLQVVTDRRQREQDLREEQAFTEAIFGALPDLFYAFDPFGNFLRWNDQVKEVTGYSDEELAELSPQDFVVPGDRPKAMEAMGDIIEDGATTTIEVQVQTKDGERIPYELTGARMTDDNGETLGLVGIGRDISDRKKRQRRFQAAFDNTYQFTGLLQPDGTLLEANQTALEFGGIDRDEVVGEKMWDAYWFQDNEEAQEAARRAVDQAQDGGFFRDVITVQGVNGTEVIDFSVRPVTDDGGNVTLLVPEGRTITELKEREEHLRMMNRFLRHNLRNKMAIINGNAELLRAELDDPSLAEYAEMIEEAANDLVDLSSSANQLLKHTIDVDADREPMDLSAVLDHVATEVAEDHSTADVHVNSDTDRPVNADWRLEAVFEQLLENGVVHAEHDEPVVEATVHEREETVVVRIEDNGPGIPDDELIGITTEGDRSQLTHRSGFGLWLVRSVVDDYGGTLFHESAAEGGTVMKVSLPVATQPRSDEPAPSE